MQSELSKRDELKLQVHHIVPKTVKDEDLTPLFSQIKCY